MSASNISSPTSRKANESAPLPPDWAAFFASSEKFARKYVVGNWHLCYNYHEKYSLCDENSAPEIARQVVQAKKDGRIDDFVYSSVSESYLTALLSAR